MRTALVLFTLFYMLFSAFLVSSREDVTSNPARSQKPSRGPGDHRKYSSWTRWSHCSRSCEQKRFRSCLLIDERDCAHGTLHVQTRPCTKGKCSNAVPRSVHRHIEDILGTGGGTNAVFEELFYSNWSRWSPCYLSDCKQYRTKVCTLYVICGERMLVQQKICHAEFCEVADREAPNGSTTTASSGHASEDISEDEEEVVDNGRNDNRSCGVAAISPSAGTKLKIFGGRASSAGRWPWQVSIVNNHFENYCAGTLISNWIVTAAHCIRRRMFIKLGEHHVYRQEETEQVYRPIKVVSHPHFDVRTIENDIALIKISSNIRWGSYVHSACLPDSADLPETTLLTNSTKCVILGWGKRKPQALSGADVLHEAEVDVISHTRCRDAYHGEHGITSRMLCAGSGRGGRSDTCEGDSGGPLLCQMGAETGSPRAWKLIGITSFGDSCGKKDKYGVYTKVSAYFNWIKKIISAD